MAIDMLTGVLGSMVTAESGCSLEARSLADRSVGSYEVHLAGGRRITPAALTRWSRRTTANLTHDLRSCDGVARSRSRPSTWRSWPAPATSATAPVTSRASRTSETSASTDLQRTAHLAGASLYVGRILARSSAVANPQYPEPIPRSR